MGEFYGLFCEISSLRCKWQSASFIFITDADECTAPEANDCHSSALCTNTEGSYVCRCFRGYAGDGRVCSGRLSMNFVKCDLKQRRHSRGQKRQTTKKKKKRKLNNIRLNLQNKGSD